MSAPAANQPTPRRTQNALLVASVAAALLQLAWLIRRIGRDAFFASEDEPYRLYHAYLTARDGPTVFSRLWPPGHALALAALIRLGVPVAWSGVALGVVSLAVTIAALGVVAAHLVPSRGIDPSRARLATALIVLGSPWFAHTSFGGLAEPLATALCACAAAGAFARIDGGSRAALAGGAIALCAATWVRYESWWFVPVFALGVPVALRRGGATWRSIATDALLACVPCIGPIAWMIGEQATFGDALAFVAVNHEISEQILGGPVRAVVYGHRMRDLVLGAPVAVIFGLAALRAPVPKRVVVFLCVGALPIVVQVIDGHEQTVFPARLIGPLILAFVPVAAVVLASLHGSRERLFALLAVLPLAIVPFTAPTMLDTSSVAFARDLRHGQFDAALGGGSLLVERVPRRPPFGWASVGVLWAQWPRMVWGTYQGGAWQLAEPTGVRRGRARVTGDDFAAWLTQRGVRGAWVLTPDARAAMLRTWPGAHVHPVGAGALIVP